MSQISIELKQLFSEYEAEANSQKLSTHQVWDEVKDFLETSKKAGVDIRTYQMFWLDSTRLQIDFVPTDDYGSTYGFHMTLPHLTGETVAKRSADTNSDYDRAMKGI